MKNKTTDPQEAQKTGIPSRNTNHEPRTTPYFLLATWFGCGLSPVVSGTVGSLGALPFAYVIQAYFGNAALLAASLVLFAVGCRASNHYLLQSARDDDPGEIVVDEVAGQWLLLSFLPLSWEAYLAGFLMFRAFDIVKPWPVSLADRRIKGGFGVMLDDMLAALYPVIILFAAHYFFTMPSWLEIGHGL